MRAARVEALTPLALASSENCLFHASKPAAVLPHCAAPALPVIHRSATRTATVTVLSCPPLVIRNPFPTPCSRQTLARHPCRDAIAGSPAFQASEYFRNRRGQAPMASGAYRSPPDYSRPPMVEWRNSRSASLD